MEETGVSELELECAVPDDLSEDEKTALSLSRTGMAVLVVEC